MPSVLEAIQTPTKLFKKQHHSRLQKNGRYDRAKKATNQFLYVLSFLLCSTGCSTVLYPHQVESVANYCRPNCFRNRSRLTMTKKKKTNSNTTAAPESSNKKKRKQSHESPLIQHHQQGGETKTSSRTPSNNTIPTRKQAIKSKQAEWEEAEERRLTALLFGGGDGGTNSSRMSVLRKDGDYEMVEHFGIKEGYEEHRIADESEDAASSLVFEIDRKGAGDEPPGDKTETNAEISLLDLDSKRLGEEEKNEKRLDRVHVRDENKGGEEHDERPAWVDDDDDNLEVDLLGTHRLRKLRKNRDEKQPLRVDEFQKRLRDRYKSTMQATAQTQWAKVHHDHYNDKPDEHDDEDDDVMLSSQPLLLQGKASSTKRLPPNILKIMRCPDANQSDYNKAVVQAVHFHPGSDPDKPLLLTAGLDKTLRFFQVGAKKSEKVHGIHFPKLPIHSASFLGETGKVVVSGRRPFFYIYDSTVGKLDHVPRIRGREEKSLEKCFTSPDGKLIAFVGNDGYVILVDVQSKQWLANLKLNGSVRAVTFTPNGQYLLASGSDGDVYR